MGQTRGGASLNQRGRLSGGGHRPASSLGSGRKAVLIDLDILLRSAAMRAELGNVPTRLVALGSATILSVTGVVVAAGPASASGHRPTPGAAGLGDRLY